MSTSLGKKKKFWGRKFFGEELKLPQLPKFLKFILTLITKLGNELGYIYFKFHWEIVKTLEFLGVFAFFIISGKLPDFLGKVWGLGKF